MSDGEDTAAAPAAAAPAAATPAKKRGRKPKEGGKKTATKSDRPPTLQLILKAISVESDPKGTSVSAIKKYILANYKVKSSTFLTHMLRRAFDNGLKEGKLVRPKGQTDNHVMVGRYKLSSGEKKAAAPAKAKKSPGRPKKPAAAKKAAKSPKKAAKKPAAKKAKSPKKVKKSPKKPAAKKAGAKKVGRPKKVKA